MTPTEIRMRCVEAILRTPDVTFTVERVIEDAGKLAEFVGVSDAPERPERDEAEARLAIEQGGAAKLQNAASNRAGKPVSGGADHLGKPVLMGSAPGASKASQKLGA